MRGILINNTIHTGLDLALVMESKTLGSPSVQKNTVEIPGRNGLLEMSEALTGEPTYSNRTQTYKFMGNGSREVVLNLIDVIMSYHGQYITIVVDDYEDWYYEGRVEVVFSDRGNYVEFELTVDAQPFRYALEPISVSYTAITSQEVILNNSGVTVIPKIVTDAETTIVYGEVTYHLSAGTYEPENLALRRGDNVYSITTEGSITIEYREAVL
jgi:phage-related protein